MHKLTIPAVDGPRQVRLEDLMAKEDREAEGGPEPPPGAALPEEFDQHVASAALRGAR